MPNDLKHKIENGKPCNCKSFIDEKINLKPFKKDITNIQKPTKCSACTCVTHGLMGVACALSPLAIFFLGPWVDNEKLTFFPFKSHVP